MNTPLLLIHFNRPELTRRQIDALSRIKPTNITVLCDGPRHDRPGEKDNVDSVRKQFQSLPWKCEVRKIYRENNLGVAVNISTGISEFFSQNDDGIILEDDCLPSPSFFPFCQEMLIRYKDQPNVLIISGHSGKLNLMTDDSYAFSNYYSCWGWATWKRAWDLYDHSITSIGATPEWECIKRKFLPGMRQRLYWEWILHRLKSGTTDSWAYRLQLSQWRHEGLAIFPCVNMIENVGFDDSATNTSGLFERHMTARDLLGSIKHPDVVKANLEIDRFIEDHWHSKSLPVRFRWILNKLRISNKL
jgi:hypothetical protein